MPATFTTSLFLFALVLAPLAEAQMHARHQAPPPARIEIPRDGAFFPMQDFGGRPVVEAKIDGKGPYRFILDTGANISVIGAELNRELSLSAPAGVNAASAGGGPAPALVAIHELRMGDAVLGDMIAAVMPLGGLLKGENAPQGVLSAASFPGYLLVYDFPAKRISVTKGALTAADSQSIFEYAADQDLPTVPIWVAGHNTHVHLDTGSGFGLTLPATFLSLLPLASQPKEDGHVRLPGGEFPVSTARVDGPIELGKYKLELAQVQFSDARAGPGPAIGNIGYVVLRQFVVTLDSKNRRVKMDR